MVEQSTLLQIIQFVGLITPALAILIELLINFHGGIENLTSKRTFPFEIQILFIGFGLILFGGLVIGIKLVATLDDPLVQAATSLIFGALPFLGLTVLVVNIRISGLKDESASLSDRFSSTLIYVSSVLLPLCLVLLLYLSPVYYYDNLINENLSWWIFNETIKPVWFFYVTGILLCYKAMYSLWHYDIIPSNKINKVIGQWFVISFTIGSMYLLLAGVMFLVYLGLNVFITTNIYGVPLFTQNSILSSIPYLWSAFISIILIFVDIEPDTN